MIGFLGDYEATLDSKGRFLLPGGLKKQLPEGEASFIISRGFENSLNMYTLKAWAAVVESIAKLNDFEPKVREFKRMFLGGATEVELDSAGRMLLPPSLKAYASLTKDIVLAGNLDRINIWDAVKYNKFFENISDAGFSSLAKEVMGNGISGSN